MKAVLTEDIPRIKGVLSKRDWLQGVLSDRGSLKGIISSDFSHRFDIKPATTSNYPTSISFTNMKGRPKMFVLKSTSQISSSGNISYYYIVEIQSYTNEDGETIHGSCFRVGGTRRVYHITHGYSWTYNGTTLIITSDAENRAESPGAFNGAYELWYAY